MNTNHPEITLLFKKEESFCDLLLIMDLVANPYLTREVMENAIRHGIWRFHDMGVEEVHHLTLLFGGDFASAKALGDADPFCWIIDPLERRLYVPEGKVEDYYGMREQIENILTAPEPTPDRSAVVYDSSGRVMRTLRQQPLVNHGLFVVNVIVFMLSTLSGFGLNELGKLAIDRVQSGEYYRIVTAMFLHGGIEHIIGNMLMLYYVGNMIENEMGHLRYFLLYMLSGIAAGCASMGVQQYLLVTTGHAPASVGASGAIFGILGGYLWIVLRNRGKLKNNMTTRKVIWLIAYPLYMGFVSEHVDNAAHVGGLVAGFLFAILLYKKEGVTKSARKDIIDTRSGFNSERCRK